MCSSAAVVAMSRSCSKYARSASCSGGLARSTERISSTFGPSRSGGTSLTMNVPRSKSSNRTVPPVRACATASSASRSEWWMSVIAQMLRPMPIRAPGIASASAVEMSPWTNAS